MSKNGTELSRISSLGTNSILLLNSEVHFRNTILGFQDHHDMDSFASGGRRFSTQDDDEDDEAAHEAMMNRQSVIKFAQDVAEEDDLEREVSSETLKIFSMLFLS